MQRQRTAIHLLNWKDRLTSHWQKDESIPKIKYQHILKANITWVEKKKKKLYFRTTTPKYTSKSRLYNVWRNKLRFLLKPPLPLF